MSGAAARRPTAQVTRPLGLVSGVVLLAAVVAAADLVGDHLATVAVLVVATSISHWLPAGWIDVEDATHSISIGGLWITVAAVLLPAPLTIIIGAVGQGTGWALTCTFGAGRHHPPFNLDAGIVNTSIGTLGGLAGAAAVAPFDAVVPAAVAGGVAAGLTASVLMALLDGLVSGSSPVRLWLRDQQVAAPAMVLEILGAIVVLLSANVFGPAWPTAVGTALVVLFWRLAATIHHHRTVTTTLLALTTSANSVTAVEEVRALVADAGRGILGREVRLVPADTPEDDDPPVAIATVGGTGWVLRVGDGTIGRPFGSGPHDRPGLDGLAAAAEVALLAARSRQEIRALATRDELTGLLNRRGFDEAAARLGERARHDGRPTTVAYVDLDGFKRVNDTIGHDAGDQVIAAVGEALRTRLRPQDVVGRLGGDEFAVVFGDELDPDAAGSRLEAAMRDLPHGVGGSIGVVVGSDDVMTLVARADQEMYAEKRRRRAATG